MEYQYHDTKAYKLYLLNTDKFKTITIKINFRRKIVKDEITIRSFIHPLLLLSSKNYPSDRLLSKEMERLYGAFIVPSENRIGNYSITSFTMTMINDKYTEPGMNNKCLAFLKEVLFNPDVEDNAFNIRSFNIVKNEIQAKLRSIKDNPKHYSMIRMLEHLGPKSPLSYRRGYLEDLDKIDAKKVYDYYKSMLHSDLIDIYVLGNFDVIDMKNAITDMLPINTIKKANDSVYIKHNRYSKRLRKVDEKEDLSQAKLVIGCKIKDLTPFENKYVLPVYNNILGGPSYSKLFQSVREKNSLAYYIYTNYSRADNILIVSSGINKESYNTALKLIKAEFNNMNKGNITEEELKSAKEDLISVVKNIEDKPSLLINNYMWKSLYDLDDIEKRKKEILNVKVDDLKNISKKIFMDTVYLLHGGDTDEADGN